MNRADFKKLSALRLKEARFLLKAGLYDGAYYLAGYAVECAIKACICKRTKRFDFPDKDLANKVWTHDLKALLAAAGLADELASASKSNKGLSENWTIVKDWKEARRYDMNMSRSVANDFYSACTRKPAGVVSWLRARW